MALCEETSDHLMPSLPTEPASLTCRGGGTTIDGRRGHGSLACTSRRHRTDGPRFIADDHACGVLVGEAPSLNENPILVKNSLLLARSLDGQVRRMSPSPSWSPFVRSGYLSQDHHVSAADSARGRSADVPAEPVGEIGTHLKGLQHEGPKPWPVLQLGSGARAHRNEPLLTQQVGSRMISGIATWHSLQRLQSTRT